MYEQFYGLKRKPFQLLPDADFLFRSKKHDIALTCLEYGIYERVGFIVITGEIGTGKTTLINYLLRQIRKELPICYISQTYLNPDDFLRILCQEFSLPYEGKTKSELIELLGKFSVEQFQKGKYVILILDEAQNLPFETLEEIRMLSNLDAGSENLLQIILVGQPTLREKLGREDMRQLAQRVEVSYHLEALDLEETRSYIRFRLEKAGGKDPDLFEEDAVDEIYKYSRGIPRLINSICHMCLVYGMADEVRKIERTIVMNVLKDRAQWDLIPLEKDEKKDLTPSGKTLDLYQGNLEYILRDMSELMGTISDVGKTLHRALEEFKERITVVHENNSFQGDKVPFADISETKWKEFMDRLNSIERHVLRGIDNQNRLIRLLSSGQKAHGYDKIIYLLVGLIISFIAGILIAYLSFH
jgi:general secretion pathway protein A